MGGVTARAVDDRANGLADNLLAAPPAAPLTDAALFIDVNSQSLGKEAATKFFGWLFGGPWGGWCAPGLPPNAFDVVVAPFLHATSCRALPSFGVNVLVELCSACA